MKTRYIITLIVSLISIFRLNGQTTVTLYPALDASVVSGNTTLNDNSNAVFKAESVVGGSITRSYLGFDLSKLPAGATISSATLYFYGTGFHKNTSLNSGTGSNACYVQRTTAPWYYNTITWGTQPANTATNRVSLATSTTVLQDYTVNITNIINNMLTNPQQGYGIELLLQTEANNACMSFHSSNSSTLSKRPKLVITYYRQSYSLNPNNTNYIYSVTPRIPVTSVPAKTTSRYLGDYLEQIDYYDGLGRPLQNISINNSPQGYSTFVPHTYDAFGREAIKYLPYTMKTAGEAGIYDPLAINPATLGDYTKNQPKFYSASGDPDVEKTVYPIAETMFDNSPLNRVVEQSAPGETWKTGYGSNYYGYLEYSTKKAAGETSDNYTAHTSKVFYETNGANDVFKFSVNTTTNALVNDGYYSYNSTTKEGQLFVTVSCNENWVDDKDAADPNNLLNTTREYKDKDGKVLLKRTYNYTTSLQILNTYYVYDNLGLLRYVLSPEASDKITSSTTSLTNTDPLLLNLCYYYEYDGKKRMIVKRLPGADALYMVYDSRDRLVLTQDGEQRLKSPQQWTFTKYDIFNRPVMTGIWSTSYNVSTIRTNVAASTNLYEIRGTTLKGYSNNSFPTTTLKSGSQQALATTDLLTVTYYDDYSYTGAIPINSLYKIDDYLDNDGNNNGYFDRVVGMLTGTSTRVMNDLTKDNWITTTNYYDDKGRVIESLSQYSTNESPGLFGTGYTEVVATKYSFDGLPLLVKNKQTVNGVDNEIIKTNEYDHAGRLLRVYNQVTGDASNGNVLETEMVYNELGQLKTKKLHNTADGSGICQQELNYAYNIRGWLGNINNPDNLTGTSSYADLFAQKLLYQDRSMLSNLTTQDQFNGNISGIIYNRRNDGTTATTKSAYGFTYDALNRLKDGKYGAYTSGTSYTTNVNYNDESGITYDRNGNILSLQRKSSGTLIDNLVYTYLNSGVSNQLQSVADNAANAAGFTDVTNTNDYAYDKNGNLTKDVNKGLTSISYNILNLPFILTKDANNSTTYIYSASGAKLVTTVKNAGTTTNRYYLGAFEYDNTKALSLIKMEEGIITKTSSTYSYEYALRDHLGNTRISFNATSSGPSITQRTDYYPFGLSQANPYTSSTGNNYLYNGKESQKSLTGIDWYDYGARMYDPQLGRWHSVDPHAENYYSWSPYHYAANNPIIMIDPDGRDWYQAVDDEGNVVQGGAVMWREGSDAIDGYSNIGASYTMDLGDGVSMTYNQNTPESMTETVLNEGDWETQRELTYDSKGNITGSKNKAGDEGNCFYQAGQMVSNSGATSLGGTANNINTTDGQTNYMNAQVGVGNSVRVHVDYNGDGIGDHWVAISSRTTNLTNNSSTYNFYDPGTVWQASGTHNSNTFNVSNGTISGTTFYNGKTYTVVAVRRNQ